MNILVYANGPSVPTGFGTVIREVFTGLVERQRIPITALNFFAINYHGEPHGLPFNIWPAQIAATHDPDLFGRQRFVNMVLGNAWPCDLLFVLEDTFTLMHPVTIDGKSEPMLPGLIAAMRRQVVHGRPRFRVIQYLPVDCDLLRPEWIAWMATGTDDRMVDAPVAYTAFGKRVMCDRFPVLDAAMRVIPHGTNPEVFHPIGPEERAQIRTQMGIGPTQPLLLCVQRNQPRKDVVKVMQAFAEVRKVVPEAILYCHMNVRDSAGFALDVIAHDLRLPMGSIRFPHNFSEGTGVSLSLLNQILNAGDLFVTTARGEGWGLCVERHTPIDTVVGPKRVCDVGVGDEVLTRDGYRRVLDKIIRRAPTLTLRAYGQQRVTATAEHPYYCLPLTRQQVRSRTDIEAQARWMRADAMKVGWFVGTPRPVFSEPIPISIDLAAHLDLSRISVIGDSLELCAGYAPTQPGISIGKTMQHYGVSKRIAEDALSILGYRAGRARRYARLGSGSSLLARRLLRDRGAFLCVPMRVRVRRHVALTSEVMEFFGWYLAEGSSEGGIRLEISLHAKEVSVARHLNEVLRQHFDCDAGQVEMKGNKSRLRVGSSVLAGFLSRAFGTNAQEKGLPEWLFGRDAEALVPLLRGLFLGDGHCSQTGGWTLTTASFRLAYQVRTVLSALGIAAGVSEHRQRLTPYHPVFHVHIGAMDAARFCAIIKVPPPPRTSRKRVARHAIVTDHFIWFPIRSITDGGRHEVQDLHVEGTHEFVGGGLLLHNTISDAMTVGLACVAPAHTSHVELLGDGRGVLVPCLPYRDVMPFDNDQGRPVVDVAALRDAILSLLLDSVGRQMLGQQARAWALTHTWREHVVPLWETVFLEQWHALTGQHLPLRHAQEERWNPFAFRSQAA